MLRISPTEHLNNGEVLKKMQIKRTIIVRIRKKKQLKFLGPTMVKKSLENMLFTGHNQVSQRVTAFNLPYIQV